MFLYFFSPWVHKISIYGSFYASIWVTSPFLLFITFLTYHYLCLCVYGFKRSQLGVRMFLYWVVGAGRKIDGCRKNLSRCTIFFFFSSQFLATLPTLSDWSGSFSQNIKVTARRAEGRILDRWISWLLRWRALNAQERSRVFFRLLVIFQWDIWISGGVVGGGYKDLEKMAVSMNEKKTKGLVVGMEGRFRRD